MGRLGYLALGFLTVGGGLYLLNRDYSPNLKDTSRQSVQRSDNLDRVSVPLRSYSNSQNPVSDQEIKFPNKQNRDTQSSNSLESKIYQSLVEEFSENLDATLHYGSEDRFKGNLVLGLRDIPADTVVAQYESKLESLTGQEREDLVSRYGEVVDFLKVKGSATLDSLALSKGYLGINDTADIIWPKVKDSWRNSVIGDMFADVIDNDRLSSGQLDKFIAHTTPYCNQAGITDPNLEGKIRNYQSRMADCNKIQKRMDEGTATDAEKREMEDYVRILGEIQDEFGKVTSRDKAQARVREETISSLNEINPLYGLAMEVVGLQ